MSKSLDALAIFALVFATSSYFSSATTLEHGYSSIDSCWSSLRDAREYCLPNVFRVSIGMQSNLNLHCCSAMDSISVNCLSMRSQFALINSYCNRFSPVASPMPTNNNAEAPVSPEIHAPSSSEAPSPIISSQQPYARAPISARAEAPSPSSCPHAKAHVSAGAEVPSPSSAPAKDGHYNIPHHTRGHHHHNHRRDHEHSSAKAPVSAWPEVPLASPQPNAKAPLPSNTPSRVLPSPEPYAQAPRSANGHASGEHFNIPHRSKGHHHGHHHRRGHHHHDPSQPIKTIGKW